MSAEFPLSSLYLTPRVVATAQRADVMAFDGDSRDLSQVHAYLAQELPHLVRYPDIPVTDMVFIMRWDGWGSMRAANQRWNSAHPSAPYLPADSYMTTPNGQAMNGAVEENGWVTRNTIAGLEKTVVQIGVHSWEDPGITRRLAGALLKWSLLPVSGRSLAAGTAVPQPPDSRTAAVNSASNHWPNAFSVMRWNR